MSHKLTPYAEEIIIYAARYALTRNTGAPHQVVSHILRVWDSISEQVKKQLIKEIKNEAVYCREDWARLLELTERD